MTIAATSWIVTNDANGGECENGYAAGWRPEWKLWAVWRISTGQVLALFPSDCNQHGYDHGRTRARAYLMRMSPDFNPVALDSTP